MIFPRTWLLLCAALAVPMSARAGTFWQYGPSAPLQGPEVVGPIYQPNNPSGVTTPNTTVGAIAALAGSAVPNIICDGASHPISASQFASLPTAEIQAIFPGFTPGDMAAEIDWLAADAALRAQTKVVLPVGTCIVNGALVLQNGGDLSGHGQGATVVKFTARAGDAYEKAGVIIGVPSAAPGTILPNGIPTPMSVSNTAVHDLTIDGGYPANGTNLAPATVPPGHLLAAGQAIYFGNTQSNSSAYRVEVKNAIGGPVTLDGVAPKITDSFIHDNWFLGAFAAGDVVGTSPNQKIVPTTDVVIARNRFVHNALANYPSQNGLGGYGGSPDLMTGTGPVFVLHPGGPTSFGASDAITARRVQHMLVQDNVVWGGDIVSAIDPGDLINGSGTPTGISSNITTTGNQIIASPEGCFGGEGSVTGLTISNNRCELATDALDAFGGVLSLAAQLAASHLNSQCIGLDGAVNNAQLIGNFCSGGTVAPDYTVSPPSFTTTLGAPGAFTVNTIATASYAYPQTYNSVAGAPTAIKLLGNTFLNVGNPNASVPDSLVDFGAGSPEITAWTVDGNVFTDTRGLGTQPFRYSISFAHATTVEASGNQVLVGSSGGDGYNRGTGNVVNAGNVQFATESGGGVSSFDARTGAVVFQANDVDGIDLSTGLTTASGAFPQTNAKRAGYEVDAGDYGAVCDGATHPLSGIYGSLGAAQAAYPGTTTAGNPLVTSLTQEVDEVAINYALNVVRARSMIATDGAFEIGRPAVLTAPASGTLCRQNQTINATLMGGSLKFGRLSLYCYNNNTPCLDLTGSINVAIEDLDILGASGGGQKPNLGIFAGREGASATFTGSISGTTMTVPSPPAGPVALAAGQIITGATVTPNTTVVSGSGTSWTISPSQTVTSRSLTSINIKGGAGAGLRGSNIQIAGHFTLGCSDFNQPETSVWTALQCDNFEPNAYGLIFDGANHFNIQSAFTGLLYPQDVHQSFNENTCVECIAGVRGANSIGLWIGSGTARLKFVNGYVYYSSSTAAAPEPLIVLYSGTSGPKGPLNELIDLDIHGEDFAGQNNATSLIQFQGSGAIVQNGLHVRDNFPEQTGPVFSRGAGVTSVSISNANLEFGTMPHGTGYWDNSAAFTLNGWVYDYSELFVPPAGGFTGVACSATGCVPTNPYLDTSGLVTGVNLTFIGNYNPSSTTAASSCSIAAPATGMTATCSVTGLTINGFGTLTGGTGWTTGEFATFTGGTCATEPKVQITGQSGGVPNAYAIISHGDCTVAPPANAVMTGSISGTGGLHFANTSYGVGTVAITAPGAGYQVPPAITINETGQNGPAHATTTLTFALTANGPLTVPTPPPGDHSGLAATTASVNALNSGVSAITRTGGDNTLTPDEYGNGTLIYTGTLTNNQTETVPNTGRWFIENNTTGAFSLAFITAAGLGTEVPQGGSGFVIADGTDAVDGGGGGGGGGGVTTFNSRAGNVVLGAPDVASALGGLDLTAPQVAHEILVGPPTGSPAPMTQRLMVPADMPLATTSAVGAGRVAAGTGISVAYASGVATVGATYASPALTGTPTSTTPPVGDNTTRIETTAGANVLNSGASSISRTGGTNVLSAAQYGNGTLIYAGTLVGNDTETVPDRGRWFVENNTTGAFALTLSTAGGTGTAVPQGAAGFIVADGTNAVSESGGSGGPYAPLASPALTGTPTSTTNPSPFDAGNQIATDAFVQSVVTAISAGVITFNSRAGNVVLVAADVASALSGLDLTAHVAAHTFLVGPASGPAAAMTQRLMVSADIPASAALSGSPTSPSPAVGDNTTKIATTNSVYTLISGVTSISTTGGTTTLSAGQYGKGVLIVSGTLTGNAILVVPVSGKWFVENNTTGAFSVTVKTPSGLGTVVYQGIPATVTTDGTNALSNEDILTAAQLASVRNAASLITANTAAAQAAATAAAASATAASASATAAANFAPLIGTTGSIGGGALSLGACASGTATVTGATTAMVVTATPVAYPGAGFDWSRGYVSAADTVTIQVCADVAGTPSASAYNVRVLQ